MALICCGLVWLVQQCLSPDKKTKNMMFGQRSWVSQLILSLCRTLGEVGSKANEGMFHPRIDELAGEGAQAA